jgi:hypothetical protein
MVGLALCATYLTGTMSLVGGLHDTTGGIARNFQQGPIVAYSGTNLLDSRVSEAVVDALGLACAKVALAEAIVSPVGKTTTVTTYVACVDDLAGILGMPEANLTRGSVLVGKTLDERFRELGTPLGERSGLWLTGATRPVQVTVEAGYSSGSLLPTDWILASEADLNALDGGSTGNVSFVVLAEGDETGREALESIGLTTQNSMAVINFFEKGIYQIEGALWGLVSITSVIVGLLVYSALSIEVGARKQDIRLLKKLGSGPSRVASLFAGRGLYIATCGAAIGVAFGYLAANLLISVATMRGLSTLIVPQASLSSVAAPFLLVVAAGLVGAAIPAVSAAREPMGGGAE